MDLLTFTYSSTSKQPFKDLVNEILLLSNEFVLTVDEIFAYGIFCTIGTYAFYNDWEGAPQSLEIPEILMSPISKPYDKTSFVKHIISDILLHGKEKPEWMVYVEMTKNCGKFEQEPSNFLYIIPKQEKYKKLAELLQQFLYSPNGLTIELQDEEITI